MARRRHGSATAVPVPAASSAAVRNKRSRGGLASAPSLVRDGTEDVEREGTRHRFTHDNTNDRTKLGKSVFTRDSDAMLELPTRRGYVRPTVFRSEEHTSELQAQMRRSYADSCCKKTKKDQSYTT